MSATVNVDLLATLQPLMSLGCKGLNELLPLCRNRLFSRTTDPFSSTDWSSQVG